jgi:hypothetical protein
MGRETGKMRAGVTVVEVSTSHISTMAGITSTIDFKPHV